MSGHAGGVKLFSEGLLFFCTVYWRVVCILSIVHAGISAFKKALVTFILQVPSILMMDEIDDFLCIFKKRHFLPIFWLGKLRCLQGFLMVMWTWRAGAVWGALGAQLAMILCLLSPIWDHSLPFSVHEQKVFLRNGSNMRVYG